MSVRCGSVPYESLMNTKIPGHRVESEAHMGVYVNESGILGDMAKFSRQFHGISGVGDWH